MDTDDPNPNPSFQRKGLSKNPERQDFEFPWGNSAFENAPQSTIAGSVEVFGVRISHRIELLGIFGNSRKLESSARTFAAQPHPKYPKTANRVILNP